MKETPLKPLLDGARPQAELQQLPPRDQPVLPPRKSLDPAVPLAKGHFAPHGVAN